MCSILKLLLDNNYIISYTQKVIYIYIQDISVRNGNNFRVHSFAKDKEKSYPSPEVLAESFTTNLYSYIVNITK